MIEIMKKAAKAAGEIIIKNYGEKLNVESKIEKGSVTQVDKEAERAILSILLEEYKFNAVAEESGFIENNSEYCWVIDPIDGTTNYIRQIPFFCVSIALLKNKQPEAAVIYQPLTNELFSAKRNEGVYLNGKKLTKMKAENPVIIDCNLGYSMEARHAYLKALKSILPNYSSVRNFGASALELAYLAAGRLDCFITYGDELYDVAAGILLANEAGCIVSNWDGNLWNPENKDLLVALPGIHSEVTRFLPPSKGL